MADISVNVADMREVYCSSSCTAQSEVCFCKSSNFFLSLTVKIPFSTIYRFFVLEKQLKLIKTFLKAMLAFAAT